MKYQFPEKLNSLFSKALKLFLYSIVFLVLFFLVLNLQKANNFELIAIDNEFESCTFNITNIETFVSSYQFEPNIKKTYKEISIFPEVQNILCLNTVESVLINDQGLELTILSSQKFIFYISILEILILTLGLLKLEKKLAIACLILLDFFIFLVDPYGISFLVVILNSLILIFIFFIFHKPQDAIHEKHIKEIDGLRGIAVVAVIINHFNPSILTSGYLGVDVFFVISGFVITNSLKNYKFTKNSDALKLFYKKRIKRLLPGLYFMIYSVSIFVYLFDFNYVNTINTGKWALLALSNFYLFNTSSNYFSSESYLNSFTHTWSLGIEEQFYLLFPILFLLFFKKNKKFIFILIFLSSLILFYIYFDESENGVYYLIQFRIWEILLGALIVIFHDKFKFKFKFNLSYLFLISLVLVFFNSNNFAKQNTILVCFLTFLILLVFYESEKRNFFLNNILILKIGIISYSLYLWHWPIITLSKWSRLNELSDYSLVLIMVTISLISYEYIEKPFRSSRIRLFDKNTFFTLTLLGVIPFFTYTYLNSNISFESYKGLNPGVFSNKDFSLTHYDKICHHPENISNAITNCLESENSLSKIYLIGDSHASNLVENFQNYTIENKSYELKYLIEWGFQRSLFGLETCGDSSPCIENSFSKYEDFLNNNLNKSDIVVFSTSRDWYVDSGNLPRQPNKDKILNLSNKLYKLKNLILDKGAILILIDDVPKICLQENVNFRYDIIEMGNVEDCTVKENVSKNDRQFLTNLYKSLAEDKIFYVDPHDILCRNNECSLIYREDDEFIYGDLNGHLTSFGSNLLNDFFKKEIDKIIKSNS
jgi:peptidoglycan/LPS O-acetylase OafA/YrhL